mgnify:CR=1 FL=1
MNEKSLNEIKQMDWGNLKPSQIVAINHLIDQVQELEIHVDKNSKKHANLNVFLQERDTISTLGKHVVDAVMQYTQELERQNERYREAKKQIEEKYEYFQDVPSSVPTGLSMAIEILDKVLEELK